MALKLSNMEKSAIICVASPLQAVCALEAISYFNIGKYKFYVIDDGVSLSKVLDALNGKITYKVLPLRTKWFLQIIFMLRSLLPLWGNVDCLIMGDYRMFAIKFRFIPHLRKNGKIVYVDDGNYLISLSKGLSQFGLAIQIRRWFFSLVTHLKSLKDDNYYTLFYQLIDNKKWNIIGNDMKSVSVPKDCKKRSVYIVGTVSTLYCETLGITQDKYKKILIQVLKTIKTEYPNHTICYVPHRRDDAMWIKNECANLNIEYLKCKSCIEIELIKRKAFPIEIFGFSSTALITLKRIFCDSKVTNLYIDGGNNLAGVKEYVNLIDEFAKLDIQTQKL